MFLLILDLLLLFMTIDYYNYNRMKRVINSIIINTFYTVDTNIIFHKRIKIVSSIKSHFLNELC